jgi:hypothetical protein
MIIAEFPEEQWSPRLVTRTTAGAMAFYENARVERRRGNGKRYIQLT